MEKIAFIAAADPRKPWLESRTRRSLAAAGFTCVPSPEYARLLIRAGEVLRAPLACVPPPLPPNSRLVAVGLPVSGAWMDFHSLHGGDYKDQTSLPPPCCEWHSSPETLLQRLEGKPMRSARVVHWPPLDLSESGETLRVWQIVTSLQHGGAERIALELAQRLPASGIACRLVSLGRGHRRVYQTPDGCLDFSRHPRAERAAQVAVLALREGVDVLHVHLTDAAETRDLANSGIPLVATIHNARSGWPRDWESLGNESAALMLACSLAVERELRKTMPAFPVRTVWNGIDPRAYPESPPPPLLDEVVIACVANPRPQKRLHLLPAILAELQEKLIHLGRGDLTVRLVIAGETSPDLADAVDTRSLVDSEARRLGVMDRIEWTEGARPVLEVLQEAHALVSCSAYEGLSLAHLEALSTGRPVVASAGGGTAEIAWRNPAMCLLDGNASAADFASALAEEILTPPPSFHKGIWRDFSSDRMARRVAGFLHQAACQPFADSRTLWFVTNNLSTGGAQSSLRRLAKEFHRRGVRVHLALLQEYPEHPTPGRADMLDTGIPVFVPPPSGLIDPEESVNLILTEMAADPPCCLVFWNTIAAHKLLLADALPFARIHDVSPGEMWFSAMEKCLADPPPGLPLRNAADYGRFLTSVVVKYHAERDRMKPYATEVAVIPNGIGLPPQPVCPRRADGKLIFGTAARISPQKHLAELIAAFRLVAASMPEAILSIAGGVETGSEEHAAQLRIMADGLPVEWLGNLNGLHDFHAGCDVFVMISDPAGCPNASLEALAAGLPVIATDVGGASEQVIDGETGLLVPSRNPEALAAAMLRLAADPDLRQQLGAHGREHVRMHFSMESMFRAYQQLFLPDTPPA